MALLKKRMRNRIRRPYRKPRMLGRLYKMVKKLRPETKYYGDQTVGVPITTGGAVGLLTPFAQGVADGQRVGLWCRVKSLYLNYFIQPTGATNQIARIIVFQWMDDYNSAPVLNSVLQNTTGGANAYPLSGYNWVFKDKMKILYDRMHHVGATNSSNATIVGRVRVRPKRATKFQDDQSTHYETGAVFILIVGSGTASCDYVYKVSYTDA